MDPSSIGSSTLHGPSKAGASHEALYKSATSSDAQAKSGWLGSANVGPSGTSLLNIAGKRAPGETATPSTPLSTSHISSASVHTYEQLQSNDSTDIRRKDETTREGGGASRHVNSRTKDGPAVEDTLPARIEALALDTNTQKHHAQPSLRGQPLHPSHTIAPSQDSWSSKKKILISKGLDIEPTKPKAPSQDYLAIAREESILLETHEIIGMRPKLLVLDLNQTLLVRKRSTGKASKNATPRPYLSSFWEYICGSDEIQPGVFQRRFSIMVWSSAEASNVTTMCDNMRLFTETGNQAPLLVDVWDRSSLDLTPEQMLAKFSTVKDLNKIWRLLRYVPQSSSFTPTPASQDASQKSSCWSQLDTILIDDTPSKAALQPYNHLHITSMTQPSKISGLSSYNGADGSGTASSDYKPDTCLVQIIAILEQLRYRSNVSYAIASGQFGGLGDGEQGEKWAKEGFEVLRNRGIQVTRDFDGTWASRVLQRSSGSA